ncbi:MAG: hypothetical protein SXV54_07685 [Chloroflexota bacterium]|nr:hypothetical protein [Chloroflexota bacterium]
MNGTWFATLLRVLRRFRNWLRINLLYVWLSPPERRDLLDLVAHYWIQAIKLASRYSAPRRLAQAALPTPRPCRVWQFYSGQLCAGKWLIIGGNCTD